MTSPTQRAGAEYAEREVDSDELMPHYLRHVSAMTTEGLHAKSAIAAELAWRDAKVAALQARIAELEARIANAPKTTAREMRMGIPVAWIEEFLAVEMAGKRFALVLIEESGNG